SGNLVHSLQCVRSTQVVWPATISHRVFLVSKNFLRQENRKVLLSSLSLQELQQSTTRRRRERSLLQTMRQENQKHTSFRTDQESRSWTEQSLVPGMN